LGAVLLAMTRRARSVLLVALIAFGSLLLVVDPVAASPDRCATTTSLAGEQSLTAPPDDSSPAGPGAPSGFTPPAAPPATSIGARLSVSDRSPSAGDSITVTGRGFPAGTEIAVVLYSDPVPLGGSESGRDGGFSMSV